MTRVTKGLCLYKNSDPKGLSAPAPGLYTCIKHEKLCIKSDFKDFFWNLQQMGKVTLKNVYKIRIQRDLFETSNKWSKW